MSAADLSPSRQTMGYYPIGNVCVFTSYVFGFGEKTRRSINIGYYTFHQLVDSGYSHHASVD
jgi:hypothetical protein